jgi:hypothetical protein
VNRAEQRFANKEIVALLEKIEPCLVGHPRALIIIAAERLIAGMLGPAKQETRDKVLVELPIAIRAILDKMDKVVQ